MEPQQRLPPCALRCALEARKASGVADPQNLVRQVWLRLDQADQFNRSPRARPRPSSGGQPLCFWCAQVILQTRFPSQACAGSRHW